MTKLNIASGPNLFPGWLNLDKVDMQPYIDQLRTVSPDTAASWPAHQRELVKHIREGRIEFQQKDLRQGFAEYADGSVEAVYLGQMIEHLNPIYELQPFLREVHRMLTPGGLVRLTTPDLDVLLRAYRAGQMNKFAHEQPEFYVGAPASAQLSYLMFGACGPNCTTDNYEGHMVCFTRMHLCQELLKVGFVIQNSVSKKVFADCVDMGMSHSMRVTARKL